MILSNGEFTEGTLFPFFEFFKKFGDLISNWKYLITLNLEFLVNILLYYLGSSL